MLKDAKIVINNYLKILDYIKEVGFNNDVEHHIIFFKILWTF